ADSYYNDDRSEDAFIDGWYHTGDVVTVDEEGTMKIVDRTGDLIKSGGEWISSVELENVIMAHEAVFEASVVAIPDDKWDERPVACVVLHDRYKDQISKEDIHEYLKPQFAKFGYLMIIFLWMTFQKHPLGSF